MYPRVSDLFSDLFGIEFPFPIYSFGLMVALAIIAAAYLTMRELDRMYRAGQISGVRVKAEGSRRKTEASPSVLVGTLTAMAAILGGAIGNLYDRIVRGSVVDFLDSEFFNVNIPPFEFWFIDFPGFVMHRWPVYNVADIAITVGMAVLFVFVLFEDPEKMKSTHEDSADMVH